MALYNTGLASTASYMCTTQSNQRYKDYDPAYLDKLREDIRSGNGGDRLPYEDSLEGAAACEVVDANKKAIPFSSLYERKGDAKRQRHLFIFVRHFFCGLCQDYVRELTRLLPPSSLPANTQLSIIGCGSPDLISTYASQTGCPYPLYVDPEKRLYGHFTMNKNLAMGEKPEYQTKSSFNMVTSSLMQSLSSGTKIFSGGNYSQLGGEMLFEDGEVVWCHRMRNTRDHTEISVLKEILEVP